jgi:hypothetical protein
MLAPTAEVSGTQRESRGPRRRLCVRAHRMLRGVGQRRERVSGHIAVYRSDSGMPRVFSALVLAAAILLSVLPSARDEAEPSSSPPAVEALRFGEWQALVSTTQGATSRIKILDLQTGKLSDLPGGPLEGQIPRISPDRRSFYFWQDASEGGRRMDALSLAVLGEAPKRLRVFAYEDLWGKCTVPEAERKRAGCPDCTARADSNSMWHLEGTGILVELRRTQGVQVLFVAPSGQVTGQVRPWEAGVDGAKTPVGVGQLARMSSPDSVLAVDGNAQLRVLNMATGETKMVMQKWYGDPQLGWPKDAPIATKGPRLCPANGRYYLTLFQTVSKSPADESKLKRLSGIYSCAADFSDILRVPNLPSEARLLDLSPDGNWILFTNREGRGTSIADLQGKNLRQVLPATAEPFSISWSN